MESGCMWPRQVNQFATHYVIINLHSHLFSKVLTIMYVIVSYIGMRLN